MVRPYRLYRPKVPIGLALAEMVCAVGLHDLASDKVQLVAPRLSLEGGRRKRDTPLHAGLRRFHTTARQCIQGSALPT